MNKKTSVSDIIIGVCFWIYLGMIVFSYCQLKSWEMEKRTPWMLATGRNDPWTNGDRCCTIAKSLIWPTSLPLEYSIKADNAVKQYMKEEAGW